jgi:hypothetical protein
MRRLITNFLRASSQQLTSALPWRRLGAANFEAETEPHFAAGLDALGSEHLFEHPEAEWNPEV